MNTSITSDILAVEMCVTRIRKDASDDLREVSAVSISLGMVGKFFSKQFETGYNFRTERGCVYFSL